VLISHNPNIALSLKSSVLLLGQGRPALFGTAESVVTRENLQSYFGINVIETCSSEHNLVQFVPV
jgi:ABC-type cobalamin/Fe3+-siderophores transport system ATPase subunit